MSAALKIAPAAMPRGAAFRRFCAEALRRHYGDDRSAVKRAANDAGGASPRTAQLWFSGETAPSTEHWLALEQAVPELRAAAASWRALREGGQWDRAHQLYLRVVGLGPVALEMFTRLTELEPEALDLVGRMADLAGRDRPE